ncbi:hypothetical protein [Streptomyces sp. NPDC088785]|uniref:hypothetical protein n=1 Tax=Streptomyces sp. NPDC088785 TaxID=3365897 RepID=UPI00381A4FDC
MANHTTNDVYAQLVDLDKKLDSSSKSAVTTAHFDTQIKEVKTAVEKIGKKKEDETQNWKDILKETSPVKEFLAVFKGGDFIAQTMLVATAITAAVTLVVGLLAKLKEFQHTVTGRTRQLGLFGSVRPEAQRVRAHLGRDESGAWGMQPEQAADAAQPNLPSVSQINDVKEAMGHLSTAVDLYRGKVRGLATPRAMRQMASAAKKLESAAKKHQSIDTLTGSIRELNREMGTLATRAAG